MTYSKACGFIIYQIALFVWVIVGLVGLSRGRIFCKKLFDKGWTKKNECKTGYVEIIDIYNCYGF